MRVRIVQNHLEALYLRAFLVPFWARENILKTRISILGHFLSFFIKKKTKRYLSTLKCCKESSYTNSINSREIWRLEDLKKAIHCNEVEVILFIMYYLGYSYDKEFELFEKIIDDTPVNKKDN